MSVAIGSERVPAGARLGRFAVPLAWLCGLLLVATTLEIAIDGAVGRSPLIPKQPGVAGWLGGIGERLGYGG
ncbi:MAG: hypothetical protein ACYDC2_00620, partial [Solirubrobacteraceae bacterium]